MPSARNGSVALQTVAGRATADGAPVPARPRLRAPRPRPRVLSRPSVAASVLVHGAVFVALWAGAADRGHRPATLSLRIETASAASEEVVAVEPVEPEVPLEVAPEPPLVPPDLIEATPVEEPPAPEEPTDEVADPLPALAPDPTLRVPRRRAPPPELATAPPVAPARPTPVVATPAPVRPPSPRSVARSAVTGAVPWSGNRAPVYPADARARGIEGVVVLRLRVDEAGVVRAAAVETSSGAPSLDASALEAAWTWRFSPATEDGVPVASDVRRRVRFVLDRAR